MIGSEVLSLAELEAFDPRATGHGTERDFLCPLVACGGKQRGSQHRSLSANVETGAWKCHRCGATGKLRECWTEQSVGPSRSKWADAKRQAFSLSSIPCPSTSTSPAPDAQPAKNQDWAKRFRKIKPLLGSPADDYLATRGIDVKLAARAEIGYLADWQHWEKVEDRWESTGTDRRVAFPVVDRTGELVAISTRAIDQDFLEPKVDTRGEKRAGIFITPGALVGDVWIITEAPIDALSFATVGYPALALCGTTPPNWLRVAAAFKTILLATDNDEAGDLAAVGLETDLTLGSKCRRLRSQGKDWNDDLVTRGAAALRAALNALLPPAELPLDGDPEPLLAPALDIARPAALTPARLCTQCRSPISTSRPASRYCSPDCALAAPVEPWEPVAEQLAVNSDQAPDEISAPAGEAVEARRARLKAEFEQHWAATPAAQLQRAQAIAQLPPLTDDPIWSHLDWASKARRTREREQQLAWLAAWKEEVAMVSPATFCAGSCGLSDPVGLEDQQEHICERSA